MPSVSALALVLSITALIWCTILTALLAGQKKFFAQLGKGVTKKDLQSLLRQIVSSLQEASSRIQQNEQRLDLIEQNNVFHFQKMGFVRFNPFSDTGGDQSFCICLLDRGNNGIVITSLHNREATRLYGKRIDSSVLKKEEFSAEEWKAYMEASQDRIATADK